MYFTQIINIVRKEFVLDWRQKNTVYGLLLYLASLVFLLYMLHPDPEPLVWNAFIWVSSLFISINAIAKSFLQENKSRWVYYYTIHHASTLIAAKMLYNCILMFFISIVNLCLFSLFLHFPASNPSIFILLFIVGSISFSILFTFLSSLVAKTNNSTALLAIIGFPLVFPLIILLSDLSLSTFQPMLVHGWYKYFFALLFLDILMLALSIILYPFVWKD